MALFLALFGRRDKGQNVAGKITRMSACFQSFFPSRSWKQDPTNAAPEATCLHTQTIPDILAQHFTCVQSCKSFRSGERSCLIFRSFWFLRKERSLEERKIRAQKVKCVTCWGERACPMFWATSVDWSQQRREPRDRTWKDCRNEIPTAQLQPRTHNTRTISDEALCIWGKNRKG